MLTETRDNPYGEEPEQEYIELYNAGDATVSLQGFTVSDDPHREGQRIDADVAIFPGEALLLVSDAFDPEAVEEAVPPGTRLIRMGSSLVRSGLSNAGEPILLRDAEGRRVSFIPVLQDAAREGECRSRSATGHIALRPCSPGRLH